MSESIALAFIGSLVDHEDAAHNEAFSQAGTLFQRNLVESLEAAGIDVSQLFCVQPIPSYPRGRRLLVRGARTKILGRFNATLLPFINVAPIKPLSAGMSLLPRLAMWAFRNRDHRRVMLLYNVSNPPGIASWLIARLTRSKAIALIADVEVPGQGTIPDTFTRRLDFRLQAWTMQRFDSLVVLTRRIALDFAPKLPFLLLEGAVTNAVAQHILAAPTARRRRAPDGTTIVMYAGQLTTLKGIPLLLEAFARLDHNFRLWISGSGPLREMVEDQARVDDRITYWGFPPHDDVLELYQDATMLVNPHSTRHESARYVFPSKLIEYLATGKPVVTTCSTPEIAEEYGDIAFLVADETPDELASVIRKVAALSEASRTSAGARARNFVLQHKTWEAQAARLATFIHATAQGSAIRRARNYAVAGYHI